MKKHQRPRMVNLAQEIHVQIDQYIANVLDAGPFDQLINERHPRMGDVTDNRLMMDVTHVVLV